MNKLSLTAYIIIALVFGSISGWFVRELVFYRTMFSSIQDASAAHEMEKIND